MITKCLPGCNWLRYFKSMRDSMGRRRECPPARLGGAEDKLTRLLV